MSPSQRAGDGDTIRLTRDLIPVLVMTAGILVLLFAFNLIHHLIADSLCCADDAFIAVAAKNLANGEGYVSTFRPIQGEVEPIRFDPAISTGPTLVLPAAAAIRLLGNRYWVPGAVVVIASLALLCLIVIHVARVTASVPRVATSVILIVIALNLVTVGYYEHWYALIGEIPALLLICLGMQNLFSNHKWRGIVLGGLLLGLAFQTKALAALAFPVALFFTLWMLVARWHQEAPSPSVGARTRRFVSAFLLLSLSFAVPYLAFESSKRLSLGRAGYQQLKAAEAANFQTTKGSGVGLLTGGETGARLHENISQNWPSLAGYFGGGFAASAYLLSLLVGLAALRRWIGREDPAPLALMSLAAVYTIWWICLSTGGSIRYLLIGLGLWALAVAIDLAIGKASLRKWLLLAIFLIALLPRAANIDWIAPRPPLLKPSERTEAMLETAQFLERRRPERVIAAAHGWETGVDLEYLLSGSSSLRHYSDLGPAHQRAVLYVENRKWMTPEIDQQWTEELERRRAELLFAKGPYLVYEAGPQRSAPSAESNRQLFQSITATNLGEGEGLVDLRAEGILIHPGVTPTTVTFRLPPSTRERRLWMFIAKLPSDALNIAEAGTVDVTVFVDGVQRSHRRVTRASEASETLPADAHTLTLQVDNADGKSWWDWLFVSLH
ncbi:MAG TPA: hypothetical protein VF701_04590 [Thermoanaerobaculia bacterium]